MASAPNELVASRDSAGVDGTTSFLTLADVAERRKSTRTRLVVYFSTNLGWS